MFLLATMARPAAPEMPIKVRNLSPSGMMAECAPGCFLREETVIVTLRGIGRVSGRVAWVVGGRLGVALDQAIDPKLARKPVSGGPQPQLVQASRSMWRPGLREVGVRN